jgi:hypothetical protein
MTEFAAPSTANGIKWADVKGNLLIIEVTNVEHGIATAFGETDAVRANITDVTTGDTYDDCLVFPKALQSQLRPNVGKKVLGRVTQGQAKSGQSAPWLLDAATPADNTEALAYLAKNTLTSAAPPF